MMTVNQLIKTLKTLKQDALVMLSCDNEGNYYSLLDNHIDITTKENMEDADIVYDDKYRYLPNSTELVVLYPRE